MKYYNQDPLSHLGDLSAMGAQRYGEKVAMYHQGDELTYAELDNQANKIANALESVGVTPDDRVAIAMENTLEFMPIAYGIIKAGAVAVPVNVQLGHEQLVYILEDAGVDVLFGSDLLSELAVGLHRSVELSCTVVTEAESTDEVESFDEFLDGHSLQFETVDRSFETDVCLQGYTSGTTGNPKGVPMTHQNVLTTLQAFTETEEIDPQTDTTLTITPMFHILGLIGTTLLTLYNGRSVVMMNHTDAAALLEAIDRYDITGLSAVPALYIEMVQELEDNPDEYDISSITSLGVGAAPMSGDTREKIESTFGVALVEGWGMTETVAAGTSASARGVQKGAGCIGQPIPNVEMKLVDPDTRETRVPSEHLDPSAPTGLTGYEPDFEDETTYTGEIAIRGPPIFEGYHNLPEKNDEIFDEEGWFYTNDIARVDEDRYLWMVDRADDMMIVGGENVYPAEVEDELFEHPDIDAAAVVAASHEYKGEAPVAYVVLSDDASVSETEIRKFALERVAPHAHPRRVVFVDELPRSGTGKVQRYKLEEQTEETIGTIESSDEV